MNGVDFLLLIRLPIGFLGFLKSKTEPDRTETGRFDSVSVFFQKKKNRFG